MVFGEHYVAAHRGTQSHTLGSVMALKLLNVCQSLAEAPGHNSTEFDEIP